MSAFSGKKKWKADLLLITALLLIAGLLFLALRLWREEGAVAVVRVNGVETERHALAVDGVFSLNGGSNILVIQDGQAFLREADCPDQLCVRQGKLRYQGQVITCLPNRLTVTIEGGADSGVDLVVG